MTKHFETQILKVRLKQIKREALTLGTAYVFFFLILFVFIAIGLLDQFSKSPNCFYLSGLIAFLIFSIQVNRKDKRFIRTASENAYKAVFTEYFILSLPFTAMSLFTPNWYCFILTTGAIFIASFIDITFNQTTKIKNLSKYIPPNNFEWIGGVRKNLYLILFIYILALALCFLNFVSLFLLWFLSTIILSFYIECEPLNLLLLNEEKPGRFLIKKTKEHAKIFIFFTLPILIAYTIFNFETFWITVFIFCCFLINLFFGITLKYSSYQPNEKLVVNNTLMAIAQTGIIIPFLIPIPLLMSLRNYQRAKENLSNYLDD